VNIKYKNTINTEENVEIKIPGDALKMIEIKEVTDRDTPTATVKFGIILLIRNFILYRLSIKKEHPATVNANEKAKIIKPGNKLNVMKVKHEKLEIRINERLESMILLGNLVYLEEKRVNPIIIKLMLIENIGFSIIE